MELCWSTSSQGKSYSQHLQRCLTYVNYLLQSGKRRERWQWSEGCWPLHPLEDEDLRAELHGQVQLWFGFREGLRLGIRSPTQGCSPYIKGNFVPSPIYWWVHKSVTLHPPLLEQSVWTESQGSQWPLGSIKCWNVVLLNSRGQLIVICWKVGKIIFSCFLASQQGWQNETWVSLCFWINKSLLAYNS